MPIKNIIVLNKPDLWKLNIENVEVVAAKDYLTEQRFANIPARVFNLCRSYKYQTVGYYVSLLASARGHRPIPNVTTIQDISSQTIIRSLADDIDELIQKSLPTQGAEFTLPVYFGQTLEKNHQQLGKQLYNLFQSPMFKVGFIFNRKWLIREIAPLSLENIPQEHADALPEFAATYFSKERFVQPKLKNYKYDLAILHNPAEKDPPSSPRALKKFQEAADKLGFFVEFITSEDYNRIGEYDALFIRETTAVTHHTYRFSRRAFAEGLIVIDDPWSILRCSNKVYLAELLTHAKVPIPKTVILQKGMRNDNTKDLGFPIVLKKPDSSFSHGVHKVTNNDELRDRLNELFKDSDLVIAQEFIPSDYDWRIGIIDRQPLFACKYYMAEGHWQIYNWSSNDRRLGDVDTLPVDCVPPHVLKVALKAANLIGDGFYGVDAKQFGNRAVVIEVNDNPSIDSGIEDAFLKNELYSRIMRSFRRRIEENRSK